MGQDHEHRICTYREAEEAIRRHETIYVNDCFCRGPAQAGKAPWPYCGHAVRTCMGFFKEADAPYEVEAITQARALEMMEDWKRQGHLFRFMVGDRWICFCCACGCGFFRDKEGNRVPDSCEKSPSIEQTDLAACTHCGKCVPVCAYEARRMEDGKLVIDRSRCSGCSACGFACPEDAIQMVPR